METALLERNRLLCVRQDLREARIVTERVPSWIEAEIAVIDADCGLRDLRQFLQRAIPFAEPVINIRQIKDDMGAIQNIGYFPRARGFAERFLPAAEDGIRKGGIGNPKRISWGLMRAPLFRPDRSERRAQLIA